MGSRRLDQEVSAETIRADEILPEQVKAHLLQMRKAVHDDAARLRIISATKEAIGLARGESVGEDVVVERALAAAVEAKEAIVSANRQKPPTFKGPSKRRGGRNPLAADREYEGD